MTCLSNAKVNVFPCIFLQKCLFIKISNWVSNGLQQLCFQPGISVRQLELLNWGVTSSWCNGSSESAQRSGNNKRRLNPCLRGDRLLEERTKSQRTQRKDSLKWFSELRTQSASFQWLTCITDPPAHNNTAAHRTTGCLRLDYRHDRAGLNCALHEGLCSRTNSTPTLTSYFLCTLIIGGNPRGVRNHDWNLAFGYSRGIILRQFMRRIHFVAHLHSRLLIWWKGKN